ncbi:MAG: 3-hydroxyacyl-ACP dehydratase FabZ [Polyangia bacterium]
MKDLQVGREEIEELLPHREPFLFVDRVLRLDVDREILAERELRANEPQFAGHFPGRPIMPGVLVTEALAQTAGLLIALSAEQRKERPGGRIFYLARADMKWTAPVEPGDTLELEAKLQRAFGALIAFRVRAYTRRTDVASGSVTLARVDG